MRLVEDVIWPELNRLSPPTGTVRGDWSDVRRRARLVEPSATSSPPKSHRRYLLVAAVCAIVAVVVPSLALSAGLRAFLGFEGRAEPVPETARLLLQVDAGRGEVARLYEAASSNGGTCWAVDRVPVGSPLRSSGTFNGGTACAPVQSPPRTAQIIWGLAVQPRTRGNVRGWRPPILDGWINPDLHASEVTLTWNGGSVRLPFANDHFLWVSESLYDPPAHRFPFEIVARDEHGNVVARKRIPREAMSVS